MYNQLSIIKHQYLLPVVLFSIPTIVNAGAVPTANNTDMINRYLLQNIDLMIKNKNATGTQLRPSPKADNCTPVSISVNSTKTGMLTTSDCQLDDGSYLDGYYFSATSGTTYTIILTSSAFDAYLFLLDSSYNVIYEDDDSGGGTNAKITYKVHNSGTYFIVANSVFAETIGNYTLELRDDGGEPIVNTNAASNITETCATLNGNVNANGATATASFDFGTTTSYGENISATPSSVTGTSTITATKCNLTCNTNYHYRVKATNSNGTSYGSDVGVTTLNLECGVGPAYLESPTLGSYESGIGIIRGWACEANTIEIQIDGGTRYEVAYGTSRGDTQGVCGDSNNGFGFTYNFSALSTGQHSLRAFKDNVEFANITFNVTNLGTDYLIGARGGCTVNNFPSFNSNNSVILEWSETNQQFVIKSYSP